MTRQCEYGHCRREADVALRFGAGMFAHGAQEPKVQTRVFYCRRHALIVRARFVTCDELTAAEELRRRLGTRAT